MSKLKDSRNEVRDMTFEAAIKRLAELRFNLFNLRLQLARGEVKDIRQFSQTKKDIARLQHKLRLAELERQEGGAMPEDAIPANETPEDAIPANETEETAE